LEHQVQPQREHQEGWRWVISARIAVTLNRWVPDDQLLNYLMWQRRREWADIFSVPMLLDYTHGNVVGGLRLSILPGTVEETNGEPVAVETDDGET
jgi:hypothetical protein